MAVVSDGRSLANKRLEHNHVSEYRRRVPVLWIVGRDPFGQVSRMCPRTVFLYAASGQNARTRSYWDFLLGLRPLGLASANPKCQGMTQKTYTTMHTTQTVAFAEGAREMWFKFDNTQMTVDGRLVRQPCGRLGLGQQLTRQHPRLPDRGSHS